MKKCENCSKEHEGLYASGRFCNNKCARSFSTKNKKIITKHKSCVDCSKEVLVNRNTSNGNVRCKDCKKIFKDSKRQCKYCGDSKDICKQNPLNWICKKYQIFPTLIKYFGFREDKIGSNQVFEEFHRVKNLVNEEYWDSDGTLHILMDKFNYSSNNARNFTKIMNSLNINRRTKSGAAKISILNDRSHPQDNISNCSKQGWHTTWNNKQIFYRSSYELKYAKELDNNQIDYDVEKLRIMYWDSVQKCQRIAIPDFYLIESNEIVEIKSEYTFNELNMKDKFEAYRQHGYKCKLIVDFKERKI